MTVSRNWISRTAPLLRPTANALFGVRLYTWAAAFTVFELGLALAGALAGDPTRVEPMAFIGVASLVGAVAILALGARWRHANGPQGTAVDDAPSTLCTGGSRTTTLGLIAVVLAALIGSYLEFAFSLPGPVVADSLAYLAISQHLLGRGEPAWIHYTFPYPLVITATRLIWDHVASIVLLQHALRLAAAVAVFLALRRTSVPLATVTGIMLGIDPFSARIAHHLLTESLYVTMLVFMALVTSRFAQWSPSAMPGLGLVLGVLCGWVAFFRPAGQFLIVPTLLCILLGSRSGRKVVSVILGFTVSLAMLSGVQWWLTGQPGLGNRDQIYFGYPYVYYGLFDPNSGPLAAELYTYLDRPDCLFSFAESREKIGDQLYYYPHFLHWCGMTFSRSTGLEMISLRGLYQEGIRSQPLTFVVSVLDEIRHFITHGDLIRAAPSWTLMPMFTTAQRFLPGDCGRFLPSPETLRYGCTTFQVPGAWISIEAMRAWSYAFLDLIEPYRLQGEGAWPRSLAAVLLVAFLLLESPPSVRWLLLISLMFILYHAAVTAAAQWTIPRYVLSLSPFFAILVAQAVWIIWQEAYAAWVRRSQTPLAVRSE